MVGYFERLIWIKIEWKKRVLMDFWLVFSAKQRGDRQQEEGERKAAQKTHSLHRTEFSV